MSDFEMRIPTLNAFIKRYEGAEEIVKEELLRWLTRVLTEGVRISKSLVRQDTRDLQRRIAAKPATFAGGTAQGAWGTSRSPKAMANEFGRSAGSKMPPAGALLGWMGRKGIPLVAEVIGPLVSEAQGVRRKKTKAETNKAGYYPVEFLIAKRIASRGIPAQSFIRAAKQQLEGKARADFQQVSKRIIARVAGGGA